MDHPPPTIDDLLALLRAFDDRIRASAERVSEARTNLASSLYGHQLLEFAGAAARALELGGEELFGMPGATARLRERGQQVQELGRLCNALQAMHRSTVAAWKRTRAELADDVTQLCRAADAVQLYPGFDEASKRRAAAACGPLDKLRRDRQAGARARYQRTRQHNETRAALEAEQGAKLEAMEAELQQLDLQRRYLVHGGLRPEDLLSPMPSTPGAGGTAPRRKRSRSAARSLDVVAAPPALPAARRRRRT